MKLNLIQYISEPGNFVNEDCISFGNNFGLVLDGSTGLRKNIIPDTESDAKWFVEGFKVSILKSINSNKPLPEIIKDSISEMKERLESFNLGKIDKVDQPSASIAMIRSTEDKLEVYSLGDCTILFETIDGEIIRIYDERVSKLDNKVVEKMLQLSRENNISLSHTRKLVEEDLIRNRYKKNTEGGYWILGFDENAVDYGYYKVWDLKNLKSICIFSDGFADCYEGMDMAADHVEFYRMLSETDVSHMYQKLRERQDKDSECDTYPRLKKKDDASILCFKVEA